MPCWSYLKLSYGRLWITVCPERFALLTGFKLQLARNFHLESFVASVFKARHEVAWVILGQGMAFVFGFVGIKLLTNFMTIESYGQLALGMTIAGVMNMFLYGPIANAILRFYSIFKERGEFGAYIYAIRAAHRRFAGIAILISLPLALFVGAWKGREWGGLVVAALLFGIVSGVNGSLLSLQGAARQRKIMALHQGADAGLRPALAAVAIYYFVDTGYVAVSGFLLGTGIIVLSQTICFIRSSKVNFATMEPSSEEARRRAFGQFYSYTTAFGWIALFGVLGIYSDRWLLLGMFGEKEVGIYAAIYQIASAPILILTGMISQLMVPIIFEQAGTMSQPTQIQRSGDLLFQTVIAFCVCVIFVVVAAYYFGRPLLRTLTTAEIAEYHQALWVIASALSISGLAELLAVVGFKKNRPQAYIFPKAIQAVVFLVMGYVFVKNFGILGTAISGCSASVAYLIIVIAVNRRIQQGS